MSRCSRCAAEFTCAMAEQTEQSCWCAQLPPQTTPVFPELMRDQPSCFCPTCMQEWILTERTGQSARLLPAGDSIP